MVRPHANPLTADADSGFVILDSDCGVSVTLTPRAARITAARMIEAADHATPCALVVDDDPLILMHVATILTDAGYSCYEALTVDEAILLLEQHAEGIVLLFSDVEMPGKRNGFDLANEVDRRWSWIDIVIASGRVRPQSGEMPDRATFLTKPFSRGIVVQHLCDHLSDDAKTQMLSNAF